VEIKMWQSKSCGDQMWSSKRKGKEDEGRKDVSKSGMKILLRIGGESDHGGEMAEKVE